MGRLGTRGGGRSRSRRASRSLGRDEPKLSYPSRSFAHVFEGDGFGVGLTINQLGVPAVPGGELVPADADWHPTRLGELMPVAARDDAGLGEEMRRANIADSRLWAYRLELVAQLAVRRRDDRDRAPGQPGAASPAGRGRVGCWRAARSSCRTRSR